MLKTLLSVLAAQPALLDALHLATSARVPDDLDDILKGLQWGGMGLLSSNGTLKDFEDQRRSWHPYDKTDMGRKWDEYQAALAGDLRGSGKGQVKVLVVTAVSDSEREVLLVEDTFRRLAAADPFSGDVFQWALFHHDNTTENWTNSTLFTSPARNGEKAVVFNYVGPGCKLQNWGRLPHELTKQYDYIWLLDSDLRFDFFSWALYRAVLTTLNPLVSQPSILPPIGGGQSSSIKYLPIHSSCREGFPVAMELPRTEVQAPLISTQIWPAVRTRINNGPGTTDWYMDSYWEGIAQMAKNSSCGNIGPVLVNAAPLWHQSWKTLTRAGKRGTSGKCPPWLHAEAHRRDVSSDECEEVKAALLGMGCNLDPHFRRGFDSAFQDLFREQAHQGERLCESSHGLCRKWIDGAARNRSLSQTCFTDGLEFAQTSFAKRGMVTANDTEHLLNGLQVGIYQGVPEITNQHTDYSTQH